MVLVGDTTEAPSPGSSPARWMPFVLVWLVPLFIVAGIHFRARGLVDTPGSQAITMTQAATAALANALGPWSGRIVQLVEFPNSGSRGVSAILALALTVLYVVPAAIGIRSDRARPRRTCLELFLVATIAWYGYGFYLITDGLR